MHGNKIKKSFKDFKLKFAHKVQLGFLLIAAISGAIALNDFLQMGNFEDVKNGIFNDLIYPKEKINLVHTNFQKIQFIMLKFSMEEFQSEFNKNMQEFEQLKEEVNGNLEELQNLNFDEEVSTTLSEIGDIWKNYKEIVADAIVSAAVTQNYEMGAIIATSSGIEVGNQMNDKFNIILSTLDKQADKIDKEVDDNVSSSKVWILIGMIAGTAVFIFCAFMLAPAISKPIRKFQDVVNEFALGNFNQSLEIRSNDEFGELANTLRGLRDAQKEKVKAAQKIANGELEKVEAASDADELANSFNKEVEAIEDVLAEADKLIEANRQGDLSVRGDVNKFSGGWRRIIEGVNSILDSTVAPINEASSVLNTMAQGDFTKHMEGDYKGDYLQIKENVNKVIESLSEVIGKVSASSNELISSAAQISSSTEEMAAGASEQSSQTTEVAGSIEQMTKTIIESTKNANDAAAVAKSAGDKAKEGGNVVVETINGINRIADIVVESAKTIQELGRSSDEIGEIIKVINDIAEQTNLLALNAAIEAARAGEQGRGFAVVADEVRKLAERTTKATKEIETMIKQIQRDTNGAVEAIEEGTREVEKGKELAQKAGTSLNEIIGNSDKVSEIISQLAVASEQQAATSESISKNVEAINNVTHQSAQGTQQISRAAEDLYSLTNNLQEVVKQFKLNGYAGNQLKANNSSFTVRDNGRLIEE
ncbi:MAG: methyl-accepting chemotaxis protein [Ignavibacteria bacterium]|jgi:methyl-accepting chemotaxis protein